MAINTVWEVTDLETNTRKLWKSMDFLLEMVDKTGKQVVTSKNFNERLRTKPEDVNFLIFKGRWKVTTEYIWGVVEGQRKLHPISGAKSQKAHEKLKKSGVFSMGSTSI